MLMTEFTDALKNGALELNIYLSDKQIEIFKIYLDYILEYNKHTNLTAITEPKNIAIKHFLDSLILCKVIQPKKDSSIIDIGSGAGFPGVPLKIVYPEINLTLLDSSQKRVNFLNNLMDKIGVKYAVFHERAEVLAKDENYKDKFDYVVARAVAPLNILTEYCLPFLKINGIFVALKGPNVEQELINAENSIKLLNGKIQTVEKFELPNQNGTRNLILIKKTDKTSPKYPRASAKITKKPL